MKICIPTDCDRGTESATSPHFGTAPFFTLVDLDRMHVESVPNPSCHSRNGNCHRISLLTSHSVDAVVCEGVGRRAFDALREAGIEVLSSPAGTVGWVIAAVSAGHTHRLTEHTACAGGRGHGCHEADPVPGDATV